MTHTPTPWKKSLTDRGDTILAPNGEVIASFPVMPGSDAIQRYEDRNLALRAVNAHDALVIALERCLAILNGQAVPSLREDTIANATAALILAHRET